MFQRSEQSLSRSIKFKKKGKDGEENKEKKKEEILKNLEDERCDKKNLFAETLGLLELLLADRTTKKDKKRINECLNKLTSLMREIKRIETKLKFLGAKWLKS